MGARRDRRLAAALLATALAWGPATATEHTAVSDLLGDIDEMLGVPRQAAAYDEIDPAAGCDALSLEITRLMPATRSRMPAAYQSPVAGVAFAAGTVFPPAFLAMGIPEFARLREGRHVAGARARVAALRDRLADLACYVR